MFVIKAENLTMEKGVRKLFEDVTFDILPNERVALLGMNGVGKTSLINGLLELEPIAEGDIYYGVEWSNIGYMVQAEESHTDLPLRNWVVREHPKEQLRRTLIQLEKDPRDAAILKEYNEAISQYLEVDGYQWEMEIESSLLEMGLIEETWHIPFKQLSGGQKTRAKLVKLMLENAQFIILDEPTNHLDLETIDWLVKWLQAFQGTVLFVSHEREFIDRVATAIFELTSEGLTRYEGGYKEYEAQKEIEEETRRQQYENQEKERRKLKDLIQQYKGWHASANAKASVRDPYAQKKASKQASKLKAKESALEHLEKEAIQKPKKPGRINAQMDASEFTGKRMVHVDQVSKSYGDKAILKDVNVDILKGDRIGVVGANGSGKTTFLELISGLSEGDQGAIHYNPQVKIGQFFQEFEQLNEQNTILDEIMELPNMNQTDARTILACFLFRREEVFKTIGNLSEGEKGRVAFVKLYFSEANLLILDEPNNYFDISSREIIEDALVNYPGSIVLVTHDPYLLRAISNKIISLEQQTMQVFNGTYGDWVNHVNVESEEQQLLNQLTELEARYSQGLLEEYESSQQEEEKVEALKDLKAEIERLKEQVNKLNGSL
ncbi:ribosomal protection-like ABC-F family protein [Alkalibacillus salilacus]|uniref:ATPase subunit of ABC transporter with duplicated ATPase domains n=1 Tax=Alkalibacillus salilacus TaxID=284582 RepID=A0ABT9VIT9_9BACI|nr:ABC-F type ribosomal protection protein [Alkalibacillus salilacus]MDQ0160760.1 ATPase subunit of ABC transporter with duplicated ATPase domains [Alkalibacillus salilacus]